MNSNKANEVIHAFETEFSAIAPRIAQLIQKYRASGTINTKLRTTTEILLGTGCSYRPPGGATCTSIPSTILDIDPEALDLGDSDPDSVEQFWMNIASILSEVIPLLEQFIEGTDERFEVHFCIDTTTIHSEQPVVCEQVSNSCQPSVIHCSKP